MASRQRSAGNPGSRSSESTARRTGRPRAGSAVGEVDPRRAAGRKCVLIVEDHPLNMKLFRALLELQSYRALEAREGHVGLDLAREHDPDLIILDLALPDISGIEVIRALKSDDRTGHIPIVVITASMPDEEARIRAAGADGFMTKPIATAEFLTVMRSFLENDRGA
jgi:two-component system cell cycle response regulator DivK